MKRIRCTTRAVRTGRVTSKDRGFTLIEVIIAIALMMAVIGTSFAFLRNLLVSRDRLMDDAARQRSATIVIDRLEAALLTCITGDAANGAGVSGDGQSITILARGVAAHLAEEGLSDPRVLGDLQRIEFRFDESAGVIDARAAAIPAQAPPPDGESESVEAGEDGPAAHEGDEFWPVGSAAVLRLRYHDGAQWLDSFDSAQAGRLPAAVEIAIWFEPWPGGDLNDPEGELDEDDALAAEESENEESERTFDEDAFAMQSEMELYFDVPLPDRLRVIAIADSGAEEAGSVELSEGENGEW